MKKSSFIMISGILSLSVQSPSLALANQIESMPKLSTPESTLKERLQAAKVSIEKTEVAKSVECERCGAKRGK